MIKRKCHWVKLFLLLVCFSNVFSKNDTLVLGICYSDTGYYNLFLYDTVVIYDNNWFKHEMDIAGYSYLDSVVEINLLSSDRKEPTVIYLDSVLLIGDDDTVLIDNFEEYGICNWVENIGRWVATGPNNGTASKISIAEDSINGKTLLFIFFNEGQFTECLATLMLRYMTVDTTNHKLIINYQDWTPYKKLSIKMRRETNYDIYNIVRRQHVVFKTYNNKMPKTIFYNIKGGEIKGENKHNGLYLMINCNKSGIKKVLLIE